MYRYLAILALALSAPALAEEASRNCELCEATSIALDTLPEMNGNTSPPTSAGTSKPKASNASAASSSSSPQEYDDAGFNKRRYSLPAIAVPAR